MLDVGEGTISLNIEMQEVLASVFFDMQEALSWKKLGWIIDWKRGGEIHGFWRTN